MRVHWEESETFRELYNMRGAADSQFVRTEKALIDRKEKMLKGLDAIGETLQHLDAIGSYEAARRQSTPWQEAAST